MQSFEITDSQLDYIETSFLSIDSKNTKIYFSNHANNRIGERHSEYKLSFVQNAIVEQILRSHKVHTIYNSEEVKFEIILDGDPFWIVAARELNRLTIKTVYAKHWPKNRKNKKTNRKKRETNELQNLH